MWHTDTILKFNLDISISIIFTMTKLEYYKWNIVNIYEIYLNEWRTILLLILYVIFVIQYILNYYERAIIEKTILSKYSHTVEDWFINFIFSSIQFVDFNVPEIIYFVSYIILNCHFPQLYSHFCICIIFNEIQSMTKQHLDNSVQTRKGNIPLRYLYSVENRN